MCAAILRLCSAVSTSDTSAIAWAKRLLAASASAICSPRNASIAARSSVGWVSRAVARSPCGPRLVADRHEVFECGLGDGPQFLLLLGRGIEFDDRVPDRPVGAILELGWAQRRAHEARTMPVARPEAALGHRPRRQTAGECRRQCDRRDEQPASAATARGRRLLPVRGGSLMGKFAHLALLRLPLSGVATELQSGRRRFRADLSRVKLCKGRGRLRCPSLRPGRSSPSRSTARCALPVLDKLSTG